MPSALHKPPHPVLTPKHEKDTFPHSEKGNRFNSLPKITQLGRGGVNTNLGRADPEDNVLIQSEGL